MAKEPNKTCEMCGKPMYVPPCKMERKRYCSKDCRHKGSGIENTQRAMFTKTCPICGTQFLGRKKTSNYCSTECSKKAQFKGFKESHKQSAELRVTVNCAYCGKEKTVPPSRNDGRNFFCCYEHKSLFQNQPVLLNCHVCGKEFRTNNFWANHEDPIRRPKYCSKPCLSAAMSEKRKGENNPLWVEKIVINCLQCGEPFEVVPLDLEKGRKFCSQECARLNISETFIGENHWNWTGGVAPYYGPNWHKVAAKIRARDGYCCQACGLYHRGKNAHSVHHIIPIRKWDSYETANHPDNLITICATCHRSVEVGKIPLPAHIVEKAYTIFRKL